MDHIIYVQIIENLLHVGFTAPSGTELILKVEKGTAEGANLIKAVEERCLG